MTPAKPFLETEIAAYDTYALILGQDIPFLSGILQAKLEDSGCVVHTSPQRGIAYDYVIVSTIFREQDILKLLATSGKAVVLATNGREHAPASRIPTLSLSDMTQFSAEALAATILEKLVTSPPVVHPSPPKATIHKPKPAVHVKRFLFSPKPSLKKILTKASIVTACIFLLILPFLLFGGSMAVAVTQLKHAADPSLSSDEREKFVNAAIRSTAVMNTTYPVIRPVLSLSSDVATIAESATTIVTYSTRAFSEAIDMEDELSSYELRLTEENPSLFTAVIPAIQKRLTSIDGYMQTIESSLTRLQPYQSWWGISTAFGYEKDIAAARKSIAAADSFARFTPALLGKDKERTYLVLLQNNFELRPTGGFIGSYALLKVKNGGIIDIQIQDVYEADGQLKGSVEPPAPIRVHLQQPHWFLRDSNWDPDFSESAKQAEWFLSKELSQNIDGVIGIDLFVIRHVLSATGPLYVSDYQSTVSADDFFVKIQNDTHTDFFPGSTKKRDLLNTLTTALVLKLTGTEPPSSALLARGLFSSLEEKHMLFALHDRETQSNIDSLGWGGRIVEPTQETTDLSPYRSDYLMVVDANLGVNKVNYYIQRELFTTTTVGENGLKRETVMYYKNNSPYRESTFSGTYKNYVRILVPIDSTITSVSVDEQMLSLTSDIAIEEVSHKKSVGLLMTVAPQHQRKIVLTYTIPIPETKRFLYQLMVQKQPGTDHDPFVFKIPPTSGWSVARSNIPDLPYLTELRTDTLITVDFQAGSE